ncbi:hypothetical protein ACFRI7_02995 [Streptomyces sp. NPDC056716]|uniref:hypothetical protein n=1 Tax=unclassified Streptomyces TaxID=2593676 RepID=UPI003683D576
MSASKSFFDEVRTAFAATAAELELTGPEESNQIMPHSIYRGSGVEYRVGLDFESGGYVEITAKIEMDSVRLRAEVEPLAIAAGIVEKRGGVSSSARNQKQMRKSLVGQVDYLRRVHPFLADPATAEDVMRRAGARETEKRKP